MFEWNKCKSRVKLERLYLRAHEVALLVDININWIFHENNTKHNKLIKKIRWSYNETIYTIYNWWLEY